TSGTPSSMKPARRCSYSKQTSSWACRTLPLATCRKSCASSVVVSKLWLAWSSLYARAGGVSSRRSRRERLVKSPRPVPCLRRTPVCTPKVPRLAACTCALADQSASQRVRCADPHPRHRHVDNPHYSGRYHRRRRTPSARRNPNSGGADLAPRACTTQRWLTPVCANACGLRKRPVRCVLVLLTSDL